MTADTRHGDAHEETAPPEIEETAELPDDETAADDEAGDVVRNPKFKKLSDEAASQRNRAKRAEARVTELETENSTLRLRLAFNDHCASKAVTDTEAVWRLAAPDLRSLADDEGGEVRLERLAAVVGSVLQRYPHFTEAPAANRLPTMPSGRPMNGPRDSRSGINRKALIDKFPALRRRA